MMKDFRTLRADEIDARVSTISEKGCSLLLYKDARVDMDILDEVVGATNWQRAHSRDNANCTVSIWDEEKKQWISKEDTGTESNTEKEKGLASDSFKRACFNWGIGRELYTAPFIWVGADKVKLEDKNGKKATRDKFRVSSIEYDEQRNIKAVAIVNQNGSEVYSYGSGKSPKGNSEMPKTAEQAKKQLDEYRSQKSQGSEQAADKETKQNPESKITEAQQKRMYAIVRGSGKGHEETLEILKATQAHFDYKLSKDILVKDYNEICEALKADGDLPF